MQADLAATLESISKDGPKAFYEGPIAEKIAAAVRAAGGGMTTADLKGYRAIERKPVLRGTYRGYSVVVDAAAVSPAALILIEMLNIFEGFRLQGRQRSGAAVHLLVETMKALRLRGSRAVPRRSLDFVKVPVRGPADLEALRGDHARRNRSRSARRAGTKTSAGAARRDYESNQTTHYSIIDRFGNAVSNTYTLNLSYGVGLVADGTGILLNNELDDFAAAPGVPNAYGLVGFDANAPGPRKRPLSSMTPTIVLKNGTPLISVTRLTGRQPHHHHGAAGHPQRHRSSHAARRGYLCAARASSVVAGRDDGRAQYIARFDEGSRRARPSRQDMVAVHLGLRHPGDEGWLRRRCRHPHARCARGRILTAPGESLVAQASPAP